MYDNSENLASLEDVLGLRWEYSGPTPLAQAEGGADATGNTGASGADSTAGDSEAGAVETAEGAETAAEETAAETKETTFEEASEQKEETAEGEEAAEGEEGAAAEAAAARTPQQVAEEKSLKELYREHPQLKDFLGQNPQLRPVFFKAAEMEKIYPTVEDARQAKDYAEQLFNFDKLYYSADANDKRGFLTQLYENSLDASGKSLGHYEQIAEIIVSDTLANILKRPEFISRAGWTSEQAKLAIDGVRKILGITAEDGQAGGASGAAGTGTQDSRFALRESQLAERERALSEREFSSFNDRIWNDFGNWLGSEVSKAMKPATALSKQPAGFRTWVSDTIVKRVTDALEKDTFFSNQFESMMRSGDRSPETASKLQAALEMRARHYLPNIVKSVLSDAGAQIVQRQAEREARQTAAAGRREPSASGAPGRLARPGSGQKPQHTGNYDRDADRILGIE